MLKRQIFRFAKKLIDTRAASQATSNNSRWLMFTAAHSRGLGLDFKRLASSSSTHTATNKRTDVPLNNELTVKESKRLMRLVYARVHPDLFTNHLKAQKENENSLKILRNLIDAYANSSALSNSPYSNTSRSAPSLKDLVFHVKITNNSDGSIELKECIIKASSGSSLESSLKVIFNQLIDQLDISTNKFSTSGSTHESSISQQGDFTSTRVRHNYTVTYKNMGYDDDYIDYEEFEKWYNSQNKVISLKDWLSENKTLIRQRLEADRLIQKQIEENKKSLIAKWKLKNIIFKCNWSLKNFNSYLQALNNFSLNKDTHFEGFTLVLTNNNLAGLRKNGHIHLNCAQVYEEWLNVLAVSKSNSKLLTEIKTMERCLSQLLNQIQITDPFPLDSPYSTSFYNEDDFNNDHSIISLATYYHESLNMILNNLTSSLNSQTPLPLTNNKFSNLQLVIQNVSNIKLNTIGQIVIGRSSDATYQTTVDFINKNKDKSISLFNEYVKSIEKLHKSQANLEQKLNARVLFDTGMDMDQKLDSMSRLNTYMAENKDLLAILQQSNLKIGSVYSLNENGSVQIPWNFV